MLALIVTFLLAIYVSTTQMDCGPTHQTNSKNRHLKTDKTSAIIDRMEWSLMRGNHVDYIGRYSMWGLWVTFLGSFLISGELPSAGVFLRNWVSISLVLLSLHGYCYWHSDKFSSFGSLSALEELRKRLDVNKGDVTTLDSYSTPAKVGTDELWTFTHADYALGTRHPDDCNDE